MIAHQRIFTNGEWVLPKGKQTIDVVNPATEGVIGVVALGSADDVDDAVCAARAAFATYSQTSVSERVELLEKIIGCYERRLPELARIVSQEMGAPITFAQDFQVRSAANHFREAVRTLRDYAFEEQEDGYTLRREPIGVCGLITAWNWPINLIASKLAYGLAAGCTIVLKPSELTPLSAIALAEVLQEAGVPNGVFNLVNGDGPVVGQRIAAHPDIDLVSFTGSTGAGILVAKNAAESVKRVHQELGGKSANILLPDVDLETIVPAGVRRAFANAGQGCQSPTRMFVHRDRYEEAVTLAAQSAKGLKIGDPADPETELGPVANKNQFARVQEYIEAGLAEGARLAAGGLGRPEQFDRGYYIRPTIFADVHNQMKIAQEEIFGPVLPLIPYDTEDEVIELANDTVYGLAGYVQSADLERAKRVAACLRVGRVYVNVYGQSASAPFGGYKRSGNGREQGRFGLEEYLEIKAIIS